MSDFWQSVAAHLPADKILRTAEQLAIYHANVGSFVRQLPGVILPQNTEQVAAIARAAHQYKQPLYPISQGKNWGLGSRLPTQDHCVVVDMREMRRIWEINEEFGYITLEPGVSQQEAYDTLRRNNSHYYLDVTGSGAETSVLGNLLDRGIAYNTIRVETVLNFEVVTGTGEIIQTGFGRDGHSRVKNLFALAAGPDIRGLFAQGNFGIVTRATLALQPMPEFQCSFMINVHHDHEAGKVMETLRHLRRQGYLHCVVHMGNRRRRLIAAAPIVYDYLRTQGQSISREKAEAITDKFMTGAWNAIGTLTGPRPLVRQSQRALRRALRPYGRVVFLTQRKINFAKRAAELLKLHALRGFLQIASEAYGMTCGVPTSVSLGSVYWPIQESVADPLSPDQGPATILFSLPIIPMAEADLLAVSRIAEKVCERFGFAPAITFNMLHDKALEGVINIECARHHPDQVAQAKKCVRTLNEELMREGYSLYRVDIDNMDLVVRASDPFWRAIRDMKQAIDPANIVAPGRYSLV